MDSMVKVTNLVFRYDDEDNEDLPVLNGIDVKVSRGEFVAIIGHNGSGKSTFAKHLNAILTPKSGDVLVDGMNSKDLSKLWEIREAIGMVFQNPDNQIVATIVEEDVAFGPENLGIESSLIRPIVHKTLSRVEMLEYKDQSPHYLSGGQKQRVAIAGVLAMSPKCIVFDESTAMLDPSGRKEVLKTIKKLNVEEGMTVVLITHFMDEAVQADRVIVMDKGNILLSGTPKEVFGEVSTLKEIGLDVPQVTELSEQLKDKGIDLGNGILDVKEMVERICRLL